VRHCGSLPRLSRRCRSAAPTPSERCLGHSHDTVGAVSRAQPWTHRGPIVERTSMRVSGAASRTRVWEDMQACAVSGAAFPPWRPGAATSPRVRCGLPYVWRTFLDGDGHARTHGDGRIRMHGDGRIRTHGDGHARTHGDGHLERVEALLGVDWLGAEPWLRCRTVSVRTEA
jgi:hypothetical protein